jgi:tRNA 2-thiouridine synthesizing protein D
MGTLTILIRSGAMTSQDPDTACGLAKAAIGKGHKVNLFLYDEGITMAIKGQDPKGFPVAAEQIEELIKLGAKVAYCKTCAMARGISKELFIEGVKMDSISYALCDYFKESDRLITF